MAVKRNATTSIDTQADVYEVISRQSFRTDNKVGIGGTRIARVLGVSSNTVYNAVRDMKARGIQIMTASRRGGYILRLPTKDCAAEEIYEIERKTQDIQTRRGHLFNEIEQSNLVTGTAIEYPADDQPLAIEPGN